MAKQMEEFVELAKQATAETSFVWEDMPPEQQELVIALVMKTYYEKHPEEAKEILEGEE